MAFKTTDFRPPAWTTLLLLVAITTVVLQHASAATSSAYCTSEFEDCYADEDCASCITEIDTEAYIDCAGDAAMDSIDTDVANYTCEVLSVSACCYDAGSDKNCLGNDAFVEYMLCTMSYMSSVVGGDEECTTITCDAVDGVDSVVEEDESGAGGVMSSSPTATITFALSVALVVIPAFMKMM